MKERSLWNLTVVRLLSVFLGAAFFGSARLGALEIDKTRADEKAEQPKPELGGQDDHDAVHDKLHQDSKANLKEIIRLMEKVRGDLSKNKTGEPVQSDQKEVVRKIDELIDKINQSCENGGGACDKDSGQSQGQDQKNSRRKKQTGADSQRQESEKQKTVQQNQKQGQKKSQQKEQGGEEQKKQTKPGGEPRDPGKVPNNEVADGKLPPASSTTLAEKAAFLDRWGLLPKKIVEQMRDSTGKEYPAEYREIISRYYEKLSELYEEPSAGR